MTLLRLPREPAGVTAKHGQSPSTGSWATGEAVEKASFRLPREPAGVTGKHGQPSVDCLWATGAAVRPGKIQATGASRRDWQREAAVARSLLVSRGP